MTPDSLRAKQASYEKQLEVMQANIQRLSGAIGAINEILNEQEVAQGSEGGENTDGETATEAIRSTEEGTTEDTGGKDEGTVAAA